jgi:hypothetical protein
LNFTAWSIINKGRKSEKEEKMGGNTEAEKEAGEGPRDGEIGRHRKKL